MRLLVLLLLLLNLLTFAWIQWGQPEPPPVPAELHPEKIRIVDESATPAKTETTAPPAQVAAANAAAGNKAAVIPPASPVTAPTAGTTAPATKPAVHGVCMEWGPIVINRVEDAQVRLNRLKLGDRLSAEDAATHGGPYWVYYPPLKTKADADSKVAELQGKGVKDITVVREGKWQNAISMGLYSKEAIANLRVANLKKLGVTAQIEARGKAARLFILRDLSPEEQTRVKQLQANFGGPVLRKTVCTTP